MCEAREQEIKNVEKYPHSLITILAGGTGSVKLVRGLYNEFKKNIGVISNVADNFWHYGLYICPDVDTIIYGLSNHLDKKRGWGIKNDTFNFLNHMKLLGEEAWFNLGDKDLATHVLRTQLLKEGKNLSEITRLLSHKYGLGIPIVPASDVHYETNMVTKDDQVFHLQEYWIKHKGALPLKDIVYKNVKLAKISLECKRMLENSKLIVLAPGNPISSIGPIIAISGMKNILHKHRNKVVMVSPLISNKAFSGPSEIYMRAKNIQPDIRGLINFYSKISANMIFDRVDKKEVEEKIGTTSYPQINFSYTDILMNNSRKELALASYIISEFCQDRR
ncbi:2-phospho-L-lactate transferase [Candidatus Nitrosocosmicus franklandus]|uniref:2-phospho-L-lactate transferase n=1 Tax=Candidatus Nitrosocosmicus franklandianus TaxID=1798806 RepID=A0A484IC26_9ARCH|nr:2-phospho-L-lactate transferase [Candidatus Nitrosocosmicus franklandus]VFJ14640.1 2-phospho-L-lactate transferase [Candidatus Nitrosocosmicus franklandus]